MKSLTFCLLLFFSAFVIDAQKVLIHSHNDYEQAEPLTNAIRNKVYSFEADIYLVNDTPKVVHDKKDLATAPSLNSLYIQPIINLFKANHGHISDDNKYAPILMIDIKEKGEETLNVLAKLLSAYPTVFDRKANSKAVQIVISGDRGSISKWTSWPSFILFDGRINEQYNKAQLAKVAFISDSYFNYAKQKDSTDLFIQQLAKRSHQSRKLLRLWGIPDNPSSWDHLKALGIDIINTDKVGECRKYFDAKQ